MHLKATFLALGMAATACGQVAQPEPQPTPDGLLREWVRPSTANPAIQNFDIPNLILQPQGAPADVPLVVFLPGTGGKPANAHLLLDTVAEQGYRVIGLAYNDEPALNVVCPQDPDPRCAAAFRDMRSFGKRLEARSPVQNPPAEAINHRLISLLQYLDREHPGLGWGGYLTPEGRPAWSRIILTGLSQGAGMAAYIAKFEQVNRVVLFSSPWDVTGRDRHPAPWLFLPSATPMDRWWAERHVRENTTDWLAHAYAALRIPQDHLLLFNAPLGSDLASRGDNPFHGSTILNPAYIPEWRRMFGQPTTATR